MKPFQLVRTYSGVPPVDAFNNFDGTPIVIDETTGNAYALLNNVVTLLGLAAVTALLAGYQSLTQPRVTLMASQSMSGTSVDFTGIPSWARCIFGTLSAASTTGTFNPVVRLGTSSGLDSASYVSQSARMIDGSATVAGNYTTGFGISSGSAANSFNLSFMLTLLEVASNKWSFMATGGFTTVNGVIVGSGTKDLAAALDRLSIVTTDTFDGGTAYLSYI